MKPPNGSDFAVDLLVTLRAPNTAANRAGGDPNLVMPSSTSFLSPSAGSEGCPQAADLAYRVIGMIAPPIP